MDDLYVRLQKALDEAEKQARATLGGTIAGRGPVWRYDGDRTVRYGQVVIAQDEPNGYPRNGPHIARWDPSTVLRLIERDRAELADHLKPPKYPDDPCECVQRLAEFWLTDTETTDGR